MLYKFSAYHVYIFIVIPSSKCLLKKCWWNFELIIYQNHNVIKIFYVEFSSVDIWIQINVSKPH